MASFLWGMLGGIVAFVLLIIATIVSVAFEDGTVQDMFSRRNIHPRGCDCGACSRWAAEQALKRHQRQANG